MAAPLKASLKELRESVKVVCKGPIYSLRGHRSHAMELTFQLTASGLSEQGGGGRTKHAGLENARGSGASQQEVAGSAHPAGNRIVGSAAMGHQEGQGFSWGPALYM